MGAVLCFLLGLFCSQQVEGRFLGHEGWGGLASGPSLPPSPPPPPHILYVACIIFDYLFKGTISLYFERGGREGMEGGELRSCMLGEGGGGHPVLVQSSQK